METRAHYLLVGAFVLALVAAGLGFGVWLAASPDRDVSRYVIYFSGSVGGLGVGGDVRYRGIRVGSVERASISPVDPSRVEVRVKIGTDTPIREGDQATLQIQGVTGVSYVNVEGAEAGAPLLTPPAGEEYPVIPSTPSRLQQLFEGAPDLISQGLVAATGVSEMVGEENQQLVRGILTDVRGLTRALAAREEQLGRAADALTQAGTDLAAAGKAVRDTAHNLDLLAARATTTLDTVDGVVGTDAKALLADLKSTSASLREVAAEAQAVVAENREPLRGFAAEGLPELTQFVLEARLLVAQLSRIASRLEDEGAGFLLGTQVEGVETEE